MAGTSPWKWIDEGSSPKTNGFIPQNSAIYHQFSHPRHPRTAPGDLGATFHGDIAWSLRARLLTCQGKPGVGRWFFWTCHVFFHLRFRSSFFTFFFAIPPAVSSLVWSLMIDFAGIQWVCLGLRRDYGITPAITTVMLGIIFANHLHAAKGSCERQNPGLEHQHSWLMFDVHPPTFTPNMVYV